MTSAQKDLKVILVTSQVTYIPDNYMGLLDEFVKNSSASLAGVIFLRNLDLKLAKSILGLRYLGAKRIQKQVLKNIAQLPLKKREKLLDQRGIPHKSFSSMNDDQAIAWCRQMDPHLIINARTRCIYKEGILSVPKLGCVNVHHGLLPEYRGTMCDLYALSEGRPAGFSIHKMNTKIDDGQLFSTQTVSDGRDKDYLKYLQMSSKIEGKTLSQFVESVSKEGQLPKGIQNQSSQIVFSKNPTRPQVKTLLNQGMML